MLLQVKLKPKRECGNCHSENMNIVESLDERMSTKGKSIHIIEFLGNKSDWESWSEKLLLCGIQKDYRKLPVGKGSTVGVDKIPMQSGFERALKGSNDLIKEIVKQGQLIKVAYEDLMLLINTNSSVS